MARHGLRYLFGRGGSGAPGAAGPLAPLGGPLGAYLHRERAALARAGLKLGEEQQVRLRAWFWVARLQSCTACSVVHRADAFASGHQGKPSNSPHTTSARPSFPQGDLNKNRTACDLCCTSIPAMYW